MVFGKLRPNEQSSRCENLLPCVYYIQASIRSWSEDSFQPNGDHYTPGSCEGERTNEPTDGQTIFQYICHVGWSEAANSWALTEHQCWDVKKILYSVKRWSKSARPIICEIVHCQRLTNRYLAAHWPKIGRRILVSSWINRREVGELTLVETLAENWQINDCIFNIGRTLATRQISECEY